MISAGKAFSRGLAAARQRPRLVLGIFAVDLLLAYFASWPFYETFASATEMRPFADPLAGGLKLDILSEIFARRPDVLTAGQAGAAAGTFAWIVLNWFLVAGVIGLLREPPEAATFRRFGSEAAANGFAMMRLQLWSLLAYLLAGIVLAAGAWIGWTIGEKFVNPWWTLVFAALLALPGLFCWLVVATAVDVARVRTVLGANRAMLSMLAYGFGVVRRHPRETLGVQLMGGAAWLGIGVVYAGIAWSSPFASGVAFAVLTILRELTVLLRTGVRIGSLGGTLEVVRAAVPSAPAAELVPAPARIQQAELEMTKPDPVA